MKMRVAVLMVLGCLLSFGSSEIKADNRRDTQPDGRKLDQGDDFIHGFIYFNSHLWASTRTTPCRILRIDPESLSYDRIILNTGFNNGEDLIGIADHIWVILYTTPSKLVKIDTETLEWEIALTFQQTELWGGGSLEYAFGHLWVGGRNGRIARVNLIDMSYQIYDYSSAIGDCQFHALTSGGGYIWGSSTDWQRTEAGEDECIRNTIVRINPDNPTDYASLFLDTIPICDDIAYLCGYLYEVASYLHPMYLGSAMTLVITKLE
jgi:hypothetical protein